MLWKNQLKDELMLNFEVFDSQTSTPHGIASLKINNDDGSIKYGSFEIPIYAFSVMRSENNYNASNYKLVVILNEPRVKANEILPTMPRPNIAKKLLEKYKNKLPLPKENDEEEKKGVAPKPELKLPEKRLDTVEPEEEKKLDLDDFETPFLPNEEPQYEDTEFLDDDVIVFYIDGGRFLPENISISRVVFRATDEKAQVVVKPQDSL